MIRLRVKEVAEEKGMSMRKLVTTANIAYNTLRTIYRDPYREVSTATLNKLAKALDVPATMLIEEATQPQIEDNEN
ncbi:helix-turn-helix transcriptional regulator [Ktedonobacteria bacterium brp13]|nr:helix-turn-helix transcriptional regulator [Ktedonobacteria bacterium brp13]